MSAGWKALAALMGFALAGGGCGISLQQLPKIGTISGPMYVVHALFTNVLNLPADAQVHEGTQVVGQVGNITVRDFEADLELKIRDQVRIPVGTTAEVRFDNPLGEEYVLLRPPSQPGPGRFLAGGATIPIARTDTAPSVEDTLAALATVLNGGGVAQLGTIIHEFNQTFTGNQPQIRDLLSNVNRAVTSLASNSTSVDNALAAIGNLFHQLNQGDATIVTGINTIGPAIQILAGENDQLRQLLSGLSQLSTIGNAVAQQSGQNSVKAVQALLPVVDQIVSVEQQLGPALGDLAAFEAETPKVAPGNYLQVSVTANVNLNSRPTDVTVAGAAAAAAATPAGPASGQKAITALLEGGLQ
jgi:phospholipid/cholesterol/gamma-HCH transport system substrate-binding protein